MATGTGGRAIGSISEDQGTKKGASLECPSLIKIHSFRRYALAFMSDQLLFQTVCPGCRFQDGRISINAGLVVACNAAEFGDDGIL